MKSSKNKTSSGPEKSMLEDAFLYNEVELVLSGNTSNAFDFIRGILLDMDSIYFYIGDTENGISLAVRRKEVVIMKLYDIESEMELQGGSKDHGDRGDLN